MVWKGKNKDDFVMPVKTDIQPAASAAQWLLYRANGALTGFPPSRE
jgi:hypothetical protein